MLKDLQEQIQIQKEQVTTNSNDDISNENKKRQYLTAFEGWSLFVKLKSLK